MIRKKEKQEYTEFCYLYVSIGVGAVFLHIIINYFICFS